MKEERSVARAALTHEVASWRRSALSWMLTFWASASWSMVLVLVGDWSGDKREEERDLRKESDTREEVDSEV